MHSTTSLEVLPTFYDVLEAADTMTSPDSPVLPTNLYYDSELSKRYDSRIYIASELHQVIRAYKIRGVYNFLTNSPDLSRDTELVAASAGNHAQAVAYCAAEACRSAVIFMPDNTPAQKINRVREFGGRFVDVRLVGSTVDEALAASQMYAEEKDAAIIHPFNALKVIAGQGTLGLEIATRLPEIDHLIVPAGGCGLIGGMSLVLQELSPHTQLFAAEPAGAQSLAYALQVGRCETLPGKLDTFVDGAAVSTPGELAFSILSQTLSTDDCFAITKDEIRQTVTREWAKGNNIELAAGLGLASLERLADLGELRGKTVVCPVTGGNLGATRFEEEVKL